MRSSRTSSLATRLTTMSLDQCHCSIFICFCTIRQVHLLVYYIKLKSHQSICPSPILCQVDISCRCIKRRQTYSKCKLHLFWRQQACFKIFLNTSACYLGLGDIEMHCGHYSKRCCGYCYIALKHFAVVNKANITSKYYKSH